MYDLSEVKLPDHILEVLENAIIATYEQGMRSAVENELGFKYCMYRGDNGNKCLVGHMMTDDEYVKEMDSVGYSAKELCGDGDKGIGRFVKYTKEVDTLPKVLLQLQLCHDKASDTNFRLDLVSNLERKLEEGNLPSCLGNVINSIREDLERNKLTEEVNS